MKFHRAFEMFARLLFAADARGPARRVTVKKSKRTIGTREIKMLVEIQCAGKLVFHLAHELECAKRFRAGELAEVHAQPIMRRGIVRLAIDRGASGVDATQSDVFTLGIFT